MTTVNRPLILRHLFLVIVVFHMRMQACPDQRLVFFGMDEVGATSATAEVGLEMQAGLAPNGRVRRHQQAKRRFGNAEEVMSYAVAASVVPSHGAGLSRRDVPCECLPILL